VPDSISKFTTSLPLLQIRLKKENNNYFESKLCGVTPHKWRRNP